MRNVKVISVSLNHDLVFELKKFCFVYFGGNTSRAVTEALKAFLPKYIEEEKLRQEEIKRITERFRTKFDTRQDSKEINQIEDRENKWQEQENRRKEELERKEKINKKNEELGRILSDPNYQLWIKHHREVRFDPEHYSDECWICKLYPESKN
jgi:hypothetical protein